MRKISIIGSGFSGLSAAAVLADKGHKGQVFENWDVMAPQAQPKLHLALDAPLNAPL